MNIIENPLVMAEITKCESAIEELIGCRVVVSIDVYAVNSNRRQKLQKIVCEYFGFEWEKIIARFRPREVSDAMYAYMFLAREELKGTLVSIGNDCKRDHTSVIYAVKKVRSYYKIADRLAFDVEAIKTIMRDEKI